MPNHLILADPEFESLSGIEVSLRASIYFDLLCVGQIKLKDSKLVLQKSVLGWLVASQVAFNKNNVSPGPVKGTSCHAINQETVSVQDQLEKFWLVKECVQDRFYSLEENECEELFKKTFSRDTSGRFVVKLPVKDNVKALGDSMELATKLFYNLENILAKNSEIKKLNTEFMSEYIDLSHMSEVKEPLSEINDSNIYYMPHHALTNENSLTTKLRVAFNASAKTTSGVSLNDILMVGPNIQRFQKHMFVLTSVIV